MKFIHLHTHTEYSLLDGANKIRNYINQVKKLGMNSAAITDHGVMFGVIEFYKLAKKEGINPILGCEVYVAPNSRFVKETVETEERYYHLVLLAETNVGYSNLVKIVSKSFTEGYYYKPRVDTELLKEYHEGIIALSGCLAGKIPKMLVKGLYQEAEKTALEYKEIFGTENFYLELQDHGIPEQQNVNRQLVEMSKKLGIGLVATNDVHYTYKEDAEIHDILLCIQTNKKVDDKNRLRYTGGQYYVKSSEEMHRLFPYAQEALENTQRIADRCQVDIEFGVIKLPKFDVPNHMSAWEYLNMLCKEGLRKRFSNITNEIELRLESELSVIKQMGFVDYFLIVWDYVKFAKEHNIPVGPGRGSATGSLVAYSLGITSINPIEYNLLFERFLNPERVTMPDIDVDFSYERRKDVIDYVINKYGKDRVVQIITFGTMSARGVVRDVGRVLGISYDLVDAIAKSMPYGYGIPIRKVLRRNQELFRMYQSNQQVRKLLDISSQLEGLPRHTSIHPAGVVISRNPVEEYVPVSNSADGSFVTQFTMTTLEELGLLKMDFLALRTLSVINNTTELVLKNRGKCIDIDKLEFNDQDVFQFIGSGMTDGIFQLESRGMKKFMKELKPASFEDIIAGISLYRPGPMDFIPTYIKVKNNYELISYDCPQLEPILKPTYGCIIYQEHVMQIVQNLAGFTLGRSDLVRRAMAKKNYSVMESEKKNFIYGNLEENIPGCIKNGISEEVAEKIYNDMITFARYAFTKSHAVAYAVVAYQTAYLKYYYPVEFMTALLNSVRDTQEKISEYILTCRKMGITVLSPDINEGECLFSVSGSSIRYGLSAIKSMSELTIRNIEKERVKNGGFTSLRNFISRMKGKLANKRVIECLIKAGAFDNLYGTRKQMLQIYNQIMNDVSQELKNTIEGQVSLFEVVNDTKMELNDTEYPNVGEFDDQILLNFEREVLGVYISGHPLDKYQDIWKHTVTVNALDLRWEEENNNTKLKDGIEVIVGGMIVSVTRKHTRKNELMAIIRIEDLIGEIKIIVFPKTYRIYRSLLTVDKKIFVKGVVSTEERGAKIICEQVVSFENIKKELWIKFESKEVYDSNKYELFEYISTIKGNDVVVIYLSQEKKLKELSAEYRVNINEKCLRKLENLYGGGNVKVREKVSFT